MLLWRERGSGGCEPFVTSKCGFINSKLVIRNGQRLAWGAIGLALFNVFLYGNSGGTAKNVETPNWENA